MVSNNYDKTANTAVYNHNFTSLFFSPFFTHDKSLIWVYNVLGSTMAVMSISYDGLCLDLFVCVHAVNGSGFIGRAWFSNKAVMKT